MPLQLIKTKNLRDQVSLQLMNENWKQFECIIFNSTPFHGYFQIVEILDHLIKLNSEWVSEDAPEHFFRMIQLLRSAKVDDLEFLWTKISFARRWLKAKFQKEQKAPNVLFHLTLRLS